jgi:hypothetical protein
MPNTVIAIRSSGTAAATPSLGVLANGEISLNFADGIIYYKTSSNTLGSIKTTQPAGLTTEVQFNDAGSFGGDSGFTFNKTTKALTVTGNLTAANVTSQSYVQFGDGTRQFTANAGSASAVTSVAGATGAVSNTQILTGLLTVDGSGSGLDADLLDGQQGSFYIDTSSSTQTKSGNLSITGSLTVDTNTLHVNSTNNRVGIGTTNPFNPLDVVYTSSSTDLTTGPGNSVSTGIRILNNSSTANAYSYLDLRTNNADARIVGINKGANLADFAILTDNGSGLVEGIRITSSQNVGIGTTTPGYKLEVNGSFAATTKSFVIPHPTKKGKKLRYGSLEGPENGVYIRGKTTERIIKLPAYWTKLVDSESITVNLTPIGEYQQLYVEKIEKNKVYIKNAASKNINCHYTIYGERCDVEKLEVEV